MGDHFPILQRISDELGLDKIGITSLDCPVETRHVAHFDRWIADGYHADMGYLADHRPLRHDPRGLLDGARSMIVCAVSYFPTRLQPVAAPQVSKYAYGRDYHKVLKSLLSRFAERIGDEVGAHTYRVCVDTAPLSERYWAARAGIGYIGKNQNIIIPKVGSFVFLGEILTTLDLIPTEPLHSSCGACTRCIDACPTGALSPSGLDARRCLSYLTIEHRGEIPPTLADRLGHRIYGCDTCQDVCPFNHSPAPTRHFPSHPSIIELTEESLRPFTEEQYAALFFGTAATRAKYMGMKRNVDLYFRNNHPDTTL